MNNQKREPFWIRAEEQFAGRGQGKNKWASEPGMNLTGTLVIFPDHLEDVRQFELSKLFALTSAAFLELFIEDVCIKWPNDLYAGNMKIGGLLIEIAILGKFTSHAILGAGINVNQINFADSLPNPVSMSQITGLTYDLTELEDVFTETFRNKYRLVESGDFEAVNNQYVDRLFRFNEFGRFKTADGIFLAKINGVNEYGHLILEEESGKVMIFNYQEVEYVI